MTTLGATLYTGFFAVAALWLFLTSDGPVDQVQSDNCEASDPAPALATASLPQ